MTGNRFILYGDVIILYIKLNLLRFAENNSVMKPKTVIFGIITAFVLVILFNNKEEASFWFFGEIRTSKLLILGVFFILGVITGGIIFRRKKSHPKEYSINNTTAIDDNPETQAPSPHTNLSEEDRKFLDRD
ncbi:hypothetical protein C5749_02185 [Sphingobacterium gobiense]|uniref:Uncharacterized protein n=2 Tax=Sphingobacterium gobiense TaxID=1382456 RepID=A0A2S9JS56_9SPHI|nr:hypothetical protein C5749_02185 [Sphingobacterium gobiense]